MAEISIRVGGRAGRITLQRPKALNALTYGMILDIEKAIDAWRDDASIDLVVIDAEGDKAFSAGGDIADLYATGRAGDFAFGQRFWADEYRVNAKIAEYPKPYVALMQGFTMGGGVGVSCHGSHRIVGETSAIAMPECGIGLVPDVGGSLLLARAPGRAGEYLGTTGTRMNAADAIHAGFADIFVPQERWPNLIAGLESGGDPAIIGEFAAAPPAGTLAAQRAEIEAAFAGSDLASIEDGLSKDDSAFAAECLKALRRASPLSAAVTVEMVRRLRNGATIRDALELEHRYTSRAMEHGDFLEGIRAQIIDKDRNPRWKHESIRDLPAGEVAAMLAPLSQGGLNLKEQLQ